MGTRLPTYGLTVAEYFWSVVSHAKSTQSMNVSFEKHYWNILQDYVILSSGTQNDYYRNSENT